ncbi:hypothetical protein L841_5386 [Mycobacterium sp. MAC_080597_8934]|nr:hypothetical protein L841_5386 [Mycobacterium sp. MAC_080597_8934]
MSEVSNALRAATAAVFTGGFVFAGSAAAAADPAGTPNPSDINTLAASLSKGYGLNNCTAGNIDRGRQLAVLTCGQSPDPKGPAQAKYVLFTNPENLATAFRATIKEDVLTRAATPTSRRRAGTRMVRPPAPGRPRAAPSATPPRSSGPSTPRTS